MNTKSRKTKSAEAQTPQAPAEADFVGLIKYLAEREKKLSKYSDKLRTSLQRVFDVFGDSSHCQICNCSEFTGTALGEGENKGKHAGGSHAFIPKVRVSENIADTEICIESVEDELNFERYRLVFSYGKLWLKGWRNCEIDATGVTTWLTTPEGTQRGGTPSRTELKQFVRSGRLPKFLAYATEKMAEAEIEYNKVATIAERMANAIQPTFFSASGYGQNKKTKLLVEDARKDRYNLEFDVTSMGDVECPWCGAEIAADGACAQGHIAYTIVDPDATEKVNNVLRKEKGV